MFWTVVFYPKDIHSDEGLQSETFFTMAQNLTTCKTVSVCRNTNTAFHL